MPNWLPRVPSTVDFAVMRSHGVSPPGSDTVIGSPGSSTRAAVEPFGVVISTHFTGSPIVPGLVRMCKSPPRTGVSKSS